MVRLALVLALMSCAAGLSGCGRGTSTPTAAPASPPIQEVMANAFTPQSNQLWEIAGKLYGEDGNIDPGLLGDEDWAKLKELASGMRAAAESLRNPAGLEVAAPGVKLQGEEAPGALNAAQIKALIDASPDAFAAEAGKLVEVADAILAAIQARDGNALDQLSGRLNEACTSCHTRFWYPEQAAAQ